MKQKAALPELPLPLRQAFVIVLAATLATGAFAAPAPETGRAMAISGRLSS